MYVIARAGGTPKRITFLERIVGGPAWSPDGSRLAFCADDGGVRNVWTMAADGGRPGAFANSRCTTSGTEVPVSWAPGRDILYQTDGNRNYQILNPETQAETPMLTDAHVGWAFGPRAGARGIALMWNQPGRRGTWILPPDKPARFVAPSVWPLAWSRDGATIYGFNDETADVVEVSINDGTTRVRRSLQPARVALVPAVTPDLAHVVYSAHAILSDVWTVKHFDPTAVGR